MPPKAVSASGTGVGLGVGAGVMRSILRYGVGKGAGGTSGVGEGAAAHPAVQSVNAARQARAKGLKKERIFMMYPMKQMESYASF